MDARVPAGMPAVTIGVARCAPGGTCHPEIWFPLIRGRGLVRRGVLAGGGRLSRRGLTASVLGCPHRGVPGGRRSGAPGAVVGGMVGGPGAARLAAAPAGGG
ncbi:MAG: hypothetical protein JO309_15925 [Pseudonocardiales bacterium]|nr:hypothetical protein [Pseudonocardiales bacterium]